MLAEMAPNARMASLEFINCYYHALLNSPQFLRYSMRHAEMTSHLEGVELAVCVGILGIKIVESRESRWLLWELV